MAADTRRMDDAAPTLDNEPELWPSDALEVMLEDATTFAADQPDKSATELSFFLVNEADADILRLACQGLVDAYPSCAAAIADPKRRNGARDLFAVASPEQANAQAARSVLRSVLERHINLGRLGIAGAVGEALRRRIAAHAEDGEAGLVELAYALRDEWPGVDAYAIADYIVSNLTDADFSRIAGERDCYALADDLGDLIRREPDE